MASSIIWSLLLICSLTMVSTQRLSSEPYNENEVCGTMYCNNLNCLAKLKSCVVVVGNLKVLLLEKYNETVLKNYKAEKLREVTGFVLVYRVPALRSLGTLFPYLTRIRGEEVFGNYALIVHDMLNLAEIGLYSLLKIDRGGVIIWGGTLTRYMDTVNWDSIAPGTRHFLIPYGKQSRNNICRCTLHEESNHCWNNMKCQRYITGNDMEVCHEQCFGCRKTNKSECSVCMNYTYRKECVSACPQGTIVLSVNNYCVTIDECEQHKRIIWNGTCISQCPIDFRVVNKTGIITCEPCNNCSKTCPTQIITTLRDIQTADKCVYINGSLIINIRAVPEAMEELRRGLSHIEEISGYLLVHGSLTITSLDFLSSLKRIRGRQLREKKYSFLVYEMSILQKLFTDEIFKKLKIDEGTLRVYKNPMLCVSEIDKIQKLLPPVKPSTLDITSSMNGYSAESCKDYLISLTVKVINETAVKVSFLPKNNLNIHYTILYAQVSPTAQILVIPESCSESQWFSVNVPSVVNKHAEIKITSLKPASKYAICIESYDVSRRVLARSQLSSFLTLVGKPAPPFIVELVAKKDDLVVIHWVDHKDYKRYITHYELDVALINIEHHDTKVRNHCQMNGRILDEDYDGSRHVVVMRPPPDYDTCESVCGGLSNETLEALVEEDFDICRIDNETKGCDFEEDIISFNTTENDFVKTLVLVIEAGKSEYQVRNLAPYRDYKFRLRACTKEKCSRFTRSVVRTLASDLADRAIIKTTTPNYNGEIQVDWISPTTVNGVVLAYYIQVFPERKLGNAVPQTWCVMSDIHHFLVRSEKTTQYNIRVCTMSLATTTCCPWKTITMDNEETSNTITSNSWWWSGIIVGVILCIGSILVARFWKPRRYNDTMLLIDSTSAYRNQSEPPSIMMTDFSPIYSMSLSEQYFE